jgi:outer membrane protein assembly factor BamB
MKRVIAFLALVACAAPAAPRVTTAWRWAAPVPAYVGMPAVRGATTAATYGHAVLALFDRGRLRWEAQLVGLRDVAPLITGDRVIAATDDGVATFERASGRLVAQAALGDRASTPVIAGRHTVVTTWDGRLVALGAWTAALHGPSLGPPAAGRGVVVASSDGGVAGFDAATGARRWRHQFDAVGMSAPVIARGLAIVVAPDRRAHAYELASGREQWRADMGGAGSPEAPPAARRDAVALADRLGHLVVVDVRNGHRRWSADGDGAVERGGPAFAGDNVVALPLDDGRLLVAGPRKHRVLDPPGRVSGLVASGHNLYYATRESPPSFLATVTVR